MLVIGNNKYKNYIYTRLELMDSFLTVSKELREKSKQLLGYELKSTEFRLLPYIQSISVYGKRCDVTILNAYEKEAINRWIKLKFIQIKKSDGKIIPSKKFWFAISELVYEAHVKERSYEREI